MTGTANAASKSSELIFLSHSEADPPAAKELASLLRQGDVDVWLDVERLAAGDVWMDELEAALVSAKHLIVYIGPSGVRNWVGREVRFALDRSTQDRSFRLIPVLGPGADAEALPLFLKQHQWLDLRDPVVLPQESERSKNNHKKGSPGSSGIACHMPKIETTIADAKVRSHTFAFITPAMTDKYKIPNSCTTCQAGKTSAWATEALRHWPERSPWRVE